MDEKDKILNELRRQVAELEKKLNVEFGKVWHEDDPTEEDMYLVLWKPVERRGDPFYGLCQFDGEWVFNDCMADYRNRGHEVVILAWTELPVNF